MRPEYGPTDSQRSLVESAAAFGLTQAEIAEQRKPIAADFPPTCVVIYLMTRVCHFMDFGARMAKNRRRSLDRSLESADNGSIAVERDNAPITGLDFADEPAVMVINCWHRF